MTKKEAFNQSRISFAIINHKFVHTMFDKRDHKDWLKDVYNIDNEEYEDIIRGYMKDGNVYFYTSSRFVPIRLEQVGNDALNHIQILSMVYMNVANPTCFNGMHVGVHGVSWVPIETIGRLKDIQDRRSRQYGLQEFA